MINVLMLSDNQSLVKRLNKAFNEFVGNTISFKPTNLDTVYEDVKTANLLLVNPNISEINTKKLPMDCAYAWFTEDKNSSLNGVSYVYLYQNIVEISRSLAIIIKNYQNGLVTKSDFFQNTKVITFLSCGGNTGATTIAEAFTNNALKSEKSVLHLMLSPIGKSLYLSEKTSFENYVENMEELFNENSLDDFVLINGFKTLSYALTFNGEQLDGIIKKAQNFEFDFIVIDTDINYMNTISKVLELSNDIVLITDGSENSLNSLIKVNEFSTDKNCDRKLKLIHNRHTVDYYTENSTYNEKFIAEIDDLHSYFTLDDMSNKLASIKL